MNRVRKKKLSSKSNLRVFDGTGVHFTNMTVRDSSASTTYLHPLRFWLNPKGTLKIRALLASSHLPLERATQKYTRRI